VGQEVLAYTCIYRDLIESITHLMEFRKGKGGRADHIVGVLRRRPKTAQVCSSNENTVSTGTLKKNVKCKCPSIDNK
jgi:hypothetical protein